MTGNDRPSPLKSNAGNHGASSARGATLRRRRPLPFWKKVLFTLVAGLLILGLIEVLARLALAPIEVRGPFERTPEQIADRDVAIFLSDPLLFWRLRSNLQNEDWDYTKVTTNDLGLRYGPIKSRRAVEREAGRPLFRILCVGDSITFGYRVPEGSMFPAVLERTLNAAFPSQQWEVIPLACPGYSTLQSLEHLRARIKKFDPDFLILNSGWNDIQFGDYPDKLVFEESRAVRSLQGWLRHSQLYLRLRHWLMEARPVDETPPARRGPVRRVSREDYCANIEAMAALGQKHGAPSLVVNFFFQKLLEPDSVIVAVPEYRAALAEACAQDQIPHLATPFLTEAGWPQNYLFFGEAVHPSDRGHYLAARQILVWMLGNGTLPLDEGEREMAQTLIGIYGATGTMDFAAEMRQSFGPETLDHPTSGPLKLGGPPERGLMRYLFHDRQWKGPLLQAQPVADINHTATEWDALESRPLVPPFSMFWDGWLMIPEAGEWGIGTSSDDGSFVFIDGDMWVDHGGVHGPSARLNVGKFEKGPHRLRVWYFDVGYGAEMRLLWARPGQDPTPIPAEYFRRQ